jgi:hypothetical protein
VSVRHQQEEHEITLIGWFYFSHIFDASLEFSLRLHQLREGVCTSDFSQKLVELFWTCTSPKSRKSRKVGKASSSGSSGSFLASSDFFFFIIDMMDDSVFLTTLVFCKEKPKRPKKSTSPQVFFDKADIKLICKMI